MKWICTACHPEAAEHMEPCRFEGAVDPPLYCPGDGKECEWRPEDGKQNPDRYDNHLPGCDMHSGHGCTCGAT